ncbi:MAG: hypothetical protein MUF31_13615 [Akkermansiaceae bacterium]|nr:hypothetical protein [Akkermansiaceae bacterium]
MAESPTTNMTPDLLQQPYFEHFGQEGAVHAEGVNDAVENRLGMLLHVPLETLGRGVLLRSPRAGYGKTHVMERVRQRIGPGFEFVPLRPLDGAPDPAASIEDALRRLTRQMPAAGGLTSLDFYSRQLLAWGLRPLVCSGEVPCQDRDAAAEALQKRPVETFDFHHPQAVTAHWTRENFDVLGPRLALEVSRATGCSLNQVSFWITSLFRFASVPPEQAGRCGALMQDAVDGADAERFGALLALLSRMSRVVLVVDDLEAVHGEPVAARKIAGFLATLRQEAPRVDMVVAVNDDVWESAFLPALSGGLLDRLSEVVIRLGGMSQEAVVSLLAARGFRDPAELAARMDLRPEDRYPRKALRMANETEAVLHPPHTRVIGSPAPGGEEQA